MSEGIPLRKKKYYGVKAYSSEIPEFETQSKEQREAIIKGNPSNYKFVPHAKVHDLSPSILDDPLIQLYMACPE